MTLFTQVTFYEKYNILHLKLRLRFNIKYLVNSHMD